MAHFRKKREQALLLGCVVLISSAIAFKSNLPLRCTVKSHLNFLRLKPSTLPSHKHIPSKKYRNNHFGMPALTSLSVPMDWDAHKDIIKPGPHIKVKKLDLNIIGLIFALSCFGWAFVLYAFLLPAYLVSKVLDPKRRRLVDIVIHLWAKVSMMTCLYVPKVYGIENLPPRGQPAIYVPNHCSFLDIFSLSGFLPRNLKYISKEEILKIPLIGWAMEMASHIAIRRGDRRSQLQTFTDTIDSLKNGNSVVAFAEGTRSPNGQLRSFKKGPFTMAKKAGVPVVPVSIANIFRWMPPRALLPLGFPNDVKIIIHPPIDTSMITDEEAMERTIEAVNNGLPPYQRREYVRPKGME